jgi:phage protein D
MATVAVPIERSSDTYGDFYVPYFEVKIDGSVQPKDVVRDILQVTYKDNIEEIDSFEISINNWDAATRAFKYSDADRFDPGKIVELWMGYYGGGRLRLMLKGEIVSLRPSFPADGGPTLAVSGLNVLHKLRTKPRSDIYETMTDSEIANVIGDNLRAFGARVQTHPPPNETVWDYLIQDNKLDIVFLMERARRGGYDLFVEEQGANGQATETVIHFGRSVDVRETAYKLTYRRSLIEFQPELTTAHQVGKVIFTSWDPVNKEPIKYVATRDEITVQGVGARGGQAAIDESIKDKAEVVAHTPVQSLEEARTLAREILERNAKEMVKASGSVVGVPDLRAGTALEIDGVGARFTGRYFVTSTTHTIGDGGYTTQFECRREDT